MLTNGAIVVQITPQALACVDMIEIIMRGAVHSQHLGRKHGYPKSPNAVTCKKDLILILRFASTRILKTVSLVLKSIRRERTLTTHRA